MSTSSKTSSASLMSVIAGLLMLASAGFLWPPSMTITLATVTVVSGHIARSAIRRDPDRLEGSALAATGLAIGYVGLLAGIGALVLLHLGFMMFGGR